MWVLAVIVLLILLIAATVYLTLRTQDRKSEEQFHIDAIRAAVNKDKVIIGQDEKTLSDAKAFVEVHKAALTDIYKQSGLSANEIADRFNKLGF